MSAQTIAWKPMDVVKARSCLMRLPKVLRTVGKIAKLTMDAIGSVLPWITSYAYSCLPATITHRRTKEFAQVDLATAPLDHHRTGMTI